MADLRMKGLSLKAAEDGQESGTFVGYLSTYGNTDRDGDEILKGAFDASVKNKSVVPMLYNHNRDNVIGKLELTTDDKGLRVKGYFNMNDPLAVKVHDLVNLGALDSMSVGMAIKDYEPIDVKHPFGGWVIKGADVYEGSVVTIPANAQALIDSAKSLSSNEREELERLRSEKQLEAKRASILAKFN